MAVRSANRPPLNLRTALRSVVEKPPVSITRHNFLEHRGEAFRIAACVGEHISKAALVQQSAVLRKHREQAAHQEMRHRFGLIAAIFEELADVGEPFCDIARDLGGVFGWVERVGRSEEHTSELQSLMRISYAVFCLNTKK